MKKYLFIFKIEIMSNLQYLFNIFIGFIGYFFMLFIFLNLWKYIYSDPSEVINGYTMSQMVWYIIITEVLWGTLAGRKLCRRIVDDVRGGNIAYNINKPYSYIGYSLSTHLGDCFIRFVMYLILGLLVGLLFLGSFPSINILQFLGVVLSMIFSTVISSLLIIGIGLLSFIVEDANPFYWLYSKFILVIGTIFPIEYFPSVIQPILNLSPIFAICYGPAKLFVDFSFSNFAYVIGAQIFYLIVGYMICGLLYKKGVRNLNVNGG